MRTLGSHPPHKPLLAGHLTSQTVHNQPTLPLTFSLTVCTQRSRSQNATLHLTCQPPLRLERTETSLSPLERAYPLGKVLNHHLPVKYGLGDLLPAGLQDLLLVRLNNIFVTVYYSKMVVLCCAVSPPPVIASTTSSVPSPKHTVPAPTSKPQPVKKR